MPNYIAKGLIGTLWPNPIPVCERLPPSATVVLAFSHGQWEEATFQDRSGTFGLKVWHYWTSEATGNELPNVTHWLPLPPPPTPVASATT